MEAIAAAASIAGIITVAAQAIDGLQTLHNFFTDISSASKTVSRLLSDINSLIAVLHNIDNVLHQVERQREDQNFAQLDIKVDDCTKDVKIWLETAKDLRPAGDKGGRAWVRRARLAAKGEVVGRIREEIGRHKQALCLSLAVFGRTIDLHTSDQIYQMRGRFDDALTSSLSNYGAHEEALRRIESYSITSMQSSAHSIRSMDSIRTELSRLEAMIVSTQSTSTSRIEQADASLLVDPSQGEGQDRAPDANGNKDTSEAFPSVAPRHLMPNSASQSSHNGSSSASRYSSKASSLVRTGNPGEISLRTRPADFHHLVREQEDISKRFSEISDRREGALLYAEFSRDTSPLKKVGEDKAADARKPDHRSSAQASLRAEGPHADNCSSSNYSARSGRLLATAHDPSLAKEGKLSRSARTSISQRVDDKSTGSCDLPPESKVAPIDIDHGATYGLLHQSLVMMYPPMVAEYVSLQNLIVLYESHSNVLEETPSIISNNAKQARNVSTNTVQPQIRKLKDQLEALQEAADNSARRCTEAGYSLSELDRIIFSTGGHNSAHGRRNMLADAHIGQSSLEGTSDRNGGSSSDESDAYFSSAE